MKINSFRYPKVKLYILQVPTNFTKHIFILGTLMASLNQKKQHMTVSLFLCTSGSDLRGDSWGTESAKSPYQGSKAERS